MMIVDSSNLYGNMPHSYQENLIDEIYEIRIDEPIPQISNDFCKYYNAVHTTTNETYFAIVFNNDFLVDIEQLSRLKCSHFLYLNNIVTYSVVKLSNAKAWRLVAIVDKYDYNNTLANYILSNGTLKIEEIENLISNFVELFEQLNPLNINCNNIHPSNLIILDNGNFMLREFFISYPNFYQENHYLSPEIADCIDAGRTVSGFTNDIYALGVTIFYCLLAKTPWNNYENINAYNYARFEDGTFKVLVGKTKILERIRELLRFTLANDMKLRATINDLKKWLAGTLEKIIRFDLESDNSNFLAFKDNNYSNVRSIATALNSNWNESLMFIKDERLFKWVRRNNLNIQIIEKLENLFHLSNGSRGVSEDRGVILAKILMLIEQNSVIRYEGIALTVSSLSRALHYFTVKGHRFLIECVIKIIREKLFLYTTEKLPENLSQYLNDINRLFAFSSIVFGIERTIYLLNPSAACMSSSLSEHYIVSLKDMLIFLDYYAMSNPEKFIIDRHMIAFLADKLRISSDNEVNILQHFPQLADHYLIHSLVILSVAQERENELNISNLVKVLVDKIIDLFDHVLHNVAMKEKFINNLLDATNSGNLSKVVAVIKNNKEFVTEHVGYNKACQEVAQLDHRMSFLRSEENIYNSTLFMAQKTTVLISYILCLIVTTLIIL